MLRAKIVYVANKGLPRWRKCHRFRGALKCNQSPKNDEEGACSMS